MIVEDNLSLEIEPNGGWDSRLHIAKCGDMVRAYIVVCQRFVLVYDTLLGPLSGTWLRQTALDLAQGRPLLVVNSHADWDHYYGNMAFPEPILASWLCRERIAGEVGAAELARKQADSPEFYGAIRLVAPSIAVEGATVLDGGDLELHLMPTVGHRPDHLALWIPAISTLLPGDCVEEPIPLVDEDSTPHDRTIEELSASLLGMLDLRPEWVLANHAAPQRGVSRLLENQSYLQRLLEQARAASSLEELQQAAPASPQWDESYQRSHGEHVRMAWEQRA